MKLVSGSHSIGQNLYHLEWCPKYRYKMFMKEENKKLCEDILEGEFQMKPKLIWNFAQQWYYHKAIFTVASLDFVTLVEFVGKKLPTILIFC